MELNDAIQILEMLADGCSPATGEVIAEESILNQREVIRALQIAIDHLRKGVPAGPVETIPGSPVKIEEADIKAVFKLFFEQLKTPTESRLTGFFLATRAFRNDALVSNKLYGKYKHQYTKGQLQDFFSAYLAKVTNVKPVEKEEVDFFKKPKFNNWVQADIDQLKEQVNELGILKTENLSDSVKEKRIRFPRAYESWNDTEKQLLNEALKHTNDLQLLAECFQRNPGAIASYGTKLLLGLK